MKKYIVYIVIAIAVIAGITYSQKSALPLAENENIKIGVILPLTGEYGALGENIVKGAELAKSEYISKHPNAHIEIIAEDDQLDGAKGLSAYKKLTSINNIDGLISASAPTLGAIYPSLLTTKLPTLTISSQPSDEQDDNVFQVSPATEPVDSALGAYVKGLNPEKPIIVYTNDSLTLKLKRNFVKGFGNDIPSFTLNRGDLDVKTVASKILAEKSSHIIFINYAPEGAQIVKEILKQDPNHSSIFIFDPVFNEGYSEYKKVLGNMGKLDGSVATAVEASNSASSTEGQNFIANYRAKYNVDPGNFSDLGYDAFNVIIKAHDKDAAAWVKNLETTNYSGATGAISFNELGTRLSKFSITKIEGGRIAGDSLSNKQ